MAGDLDRRLRFEKRGVDVSDDMGRRGAPWAPVFTIWAKVSYKSGNESAKASRIEGNSPVLIKVRKTPETDAIDHAWRAVDETNGETFNLGPKNVTAVRGHYMIDGDVGGVDG